MVVMRGNNWVIFELFFKAFLGRNRAENEEA